MPNTTGAGTMAGTTPAVELCFFVNIYAWGRVDCAVFWAARIEVLRSFVGYRTS